MAYVTVGLLLLFGTFALLGFRTIGQSTDIIYRQRLALALALTSAIDSYFERLGADLTHAVAMAGPDADLEATWSRFQESTAQRASSQSQPVALARIRADGYIDEIFPRFPFAETAIVPPDLVDRLLVDPETRFLPLTGSPTSSHWSGLVIVPAPSGNSRETSPGALGLMLDSRLGTELTPPFAADTTDAGSSAADDSFVVEIMDRDGVVVVSSETAGESAGAGVHTYQVGEVLAAGEPTVTLHSGGPTGDHVVAVVPLSTGPAVLILEQSRDAALRLPDQMRWQTIVFGGLGLAITLLVAWATTRQVVQPATALAAAAKQIASGNLDNPISVRGTDEIGSLADDLESMRVTLGISKQEIERANRELEARVQERTRQLQEVLGMVITAQEEERRRVARDLHDQTAQSLSALVISLDRLAKQSGPVDERRQMAARAKTLAQDTLAETRRLMHALRPAMLDDLGLIPAIRSFATEQLEGAGVHIDVAHQGETARLPRDIELTLFRIAQEAITNAARHAGAGKLKIVVTHHGGSVAMTVRDDGKGFSEHHSDDAASGRGLGIQGMRERCRLLGGKLTIETAPEEGTLVSLEIPTSLNDEAN